MTTPTAVQPNQRLPKRSSWMQPQRDSFLPSPELNTINDNEPSPTFRPTQSFASRALSQSHTSAKLRKPHLRQSASFITKRSPTMDNNSPRSESTASNSPRQRYSDESSSNGPLRSFRKKSGFSSLMNSIVGSPRRPAISAPENPVHVTHVGFNYDTGEFTVSSAQLNSSACTSDILILG